MLIKCLSIRSYILHDCWQAAAATRMSRPRCCHLSYVPERRRGGKSRQIGIRTVDRQCKPRGGQVKHARLLSRASSTQRADNGRAAAQAPPIQLSSAQRRAKLRPFGQVPREQGGCVVCWFDKLANLFTGRQAFRQDRHGGVYI